MAAAHRSRTARRDGGPHARPCHPGAAHRGYPLSNGPCIRGDSVRRGDRRGLGVGPATRESRALRVSVVSKGRRERVVDILGVRPRRTSLDRSRSGDEGRVGTLALLRSAPREAERSARDAIRTHPNTSAQRRSRRRGIHRRPSRADSPRAVPGRMRGCVQSHRHALPMLRRHRGSKATQTSVRSPGAKFTSRHSNTSMRSAPFVTA